MSGEGSGIGGRNNHFYSSHHRLPRFLTLDDSNGGEGEYFNPMSENHNADDHLDDFDLNLLGHPLINNTRLVDPRQALPDTFRAIFPYKLFNVVQSKCFPLVYGTNDNVVISAPTGSGKTAILELAICKLVGSADPERFKIIYQAPTKSLCSERARDWEKKFSHMNLRCVELTGDTSRAQTRRVGSASIIVTTPEKWDSITRKWSDHQKLLQFVRLVLIDEVHILNDTRGATLEAVVSRMKTISADVRFVALSATVPNLEDIAKWLGRDSKTQHEPARYEMFGEELRPVRLQKYVYGYDGPPNEFIFDKSLDGKLNLLLGKHSQKKPIMVFCFTRKSCESTAKCLAEWWSTSSSEDKAWPAPSKRIPVISKDLQEIVRYRVAFHHGGLGLEDRSAVEHYYLNGDLHVICCTSTLAVGVNLPCHTVVLKGTMGYSDGELQEYSDIDVMQMLGRAGRPQFDKTAVALVMTRRDKVDRYSKMVKGEQTLESTLHRNLAEHLNSEIGLGTIKDIATAKTWIGGTFLSVRMRQAPARYGADGVLNAAGADEMMEEWCERDIKLLQQHNLITLAPFGCTEYGNAMSRYMVQFETMKLLLTIPRGAKLEEMLTTLCKAVEFEEFRFKPTERPLFRKLNQSPFILHPIKETVTQTWHKVFLMVQIHLGGVELPNDKEFGHLKRSIFCEKTAIFDRLNRLIRCVVDCKAFDGDGVSTRVGLELARAIAANSWENKPTQLNQIPGFGPVTNPSPQDNVTVLVKANLGHCNTKRAPNWNGKVPAVTFMAEVSDGNLAYFWRGNIKKLDEARDLELKFPVVLSGPQQIISCHFNCEEIVGTQIIKKLEPQIPASAFDGISTGERRREPPKIDLLDSDLDLEEGDEADMLNVLDASGLDNEYPGPLDAADDDFPFIDDLLSQDKSNLEDDAQKMENGKWMCHHRCRNGGTTKSGSAFDGACSEDRNSIGQSNIANVNDRTPPDADSPTDYEFPDLDEFYGPNAAGNVQDFQDTVENDETLYPGVVNTLKESIDHGQDPNLSFTTVDALQKASQRLDIPSSSNNSHDSSMPLDSPSFQHDFSPELESSPPYPAVDMPEHMSLSADDNLDGLPPVATHDDEPLFFDTDSFQSDVEAEFDADAQAQQNEPLWVAEADPEIIDSFRGHISFV
ncbi:putative dead deah box dna helicase protein [Eutypa lata UCREL1]|uniref:DNA 3'-5' helicase n=1 Tax=Eutypa lata (strain UCR-EL1) TaxID=1287681 RepID=M7SJ65_EUTLA|nr:putative dead deah box dna helicase protein [Eutypa lata UCREL1]